MAICWLSQRPHTALSPKLVKTSPQRYTCGGGYDLRCDVAPMRRADGAGDRVPFTIGSRSGRLFMSDQEDPMRTTVKPVHQWTTMDGKSARKPNIEKWLFWAMFLWPVHSVGMGVYWGRLEVDIAFPIHGEFWQHISRLHGSLCSKLSS